MQGVPSREVQKANTNVNWASLLFLLCVVATVILAVILPHFKEGVNLECLSTW
jgi:hypothetical protein